MPRNNGRVRQQWRQARAEDRRVLVEIATKHWNELMKAREKYASIGVGLHDEHIRRIKADPEWISTHERWWNRPRPN